MSSNYLIKTKKGKEVWISDKYIHEKDGKGVDTYRAGFLTKLSKQENPLDNEFLENSYLHKILDLADVTIVVLDKKGIVTFINKSGCRLLNYKDTDIIGKNWFTNFLPKEIGKELKNKYEK